MRCSAAALRTLVRLRFVAVLVQLLTLAVARIWLAPHLRLWPLLALVSILAATNVALWFRLRTLVHVRFWTTAAVLLDVGLLTALLAFSGGAHNPFTALYLVHVALTAMLLGPWEVVAVLLTSSLGYASLFFWCVPLPACLGGHSSDGSGFSVHLHGMWIAFVVAGAATAGFMYRMALAIQRERETSERHVRLLGLATLAAGAAHEIGNPLSTIKVAATELGADLRARRRIRTPGQGRRAHRE